MKLAKTLLMLTFLSTGCLSDNKEVSSDIVSLRMRMVTLEAEVKYLKELTITQSEVCKKTQEVIHLFDRNRQDMEKKLVKLNGGTYYASNYYTE